MCRTEQPRLSKHPQQRARHESPATRQLCVRRVGVEPALKARLQVSVIEGERTRLHGTCRS